MSRRVQSGGIKAILVVLASFAVALLMLVTCGVPLASAVPVRPDRGNEAVTMNPAEYSMHMADREAKKQAAQQWNELMTMIANNFEHLQGTMNSPAEMAFFQAEHKAMEDLPCRAHMEQMCNPCYNFPKQFKDCGNWKSVCHKIFCAPLCLRTMWEVEVTVAEDAGADFSAELNNDNIKKSLESYFLAAGCQDHLGCCPKGDPINNWAEQRAYQTMYPAGSLASCMKEPNRAKAKESCKLSVTVRPIDGACDKFILPLKPESNPHSKPAYERSTLELADFPSHKSLRERCVQLQAIVAQKAQEMQDAFQSIACACLGCDDSAQCPHRIMYDNSFAATEEFGSDLMSYKLSEQDAKALSGGEGGGQQADGGQPAEGEQPAEGGGEAPAEF